METPGENLVAYLAENDGACFGCGYNLRGLREPRCPECRMSFEAVDRARFLWIHDQVRFESRLLLFALIVLPIELVVIAPITASMDFGIMMVIVWGGFEEDILPYSLVAGALTLITAVWVTAWIVFLRAYRRPLGRFAALADDSRRSTRLGRSAMVIDLLAVLLGLGMIGMLAWAIL
ncbi:MAG: hypothetical protein KC996_06065 [Phycisphaerales bacterium]|nr:hypothetical protein [Phycisphaerales bacterium]